MGSPWFLWRSQIRSEELVCVTAIEDADFAPGLWGAYRQLSSTLIQRRSTNERRLIHGHNYIYYQGDYLIGDSDLFNVHRDLRFGRQCGCPEGFRTEAAGYSCTRTE